MPSAQSVPGAHSQCPVPSASAHTQCPVSAPQSVPSAPQSVPSAHTISAQCPHDQCPVPTRSVPRVTSVRARPEHCNTYCMQIETPHFACFCSPDIWSVYPFRLQPLCVSPKPVWKRGGKTVKPPTKEASLCTPHQRVRTDGRYHFHPTITFVCPGRGFGSFRRCMSYRYDCKLG